MIHGMLQKIIKEQTQINGQWSDDVDARVQELKEFVRCVRQLWKSLAENVQIPHAESLKSAEKELQGSDVLGKCTNSACRVFKKCRERAPGK